MGNEIFYWSYCYTLQEKTLANFRNIFLLSSPQVTSFICLLFKLLSVKFTFIRMYANIDIITFQDGYVPYHSARIELCPSASLDFSKRGKIFLDMLNNCLDQIRVFSDNRVIMRCDINFNTSSYGRNLNTLIGRAAHIEFLESDIFAKFIMWSFPEMFR